MSGDVEYLGPDQGPQPQEPRSGRRWGLVAAGAVGVVAVAGVGAWGVTQYLAGGGPGAATAVPADALAYLTLDLDPDAGQKVEAYQTLRKFPVIEEKLGSGDDLRRSIVEGLISEAPCDDLTFDDDFDPWLGDRVAMAVLPGEGEGDEPVPVFVVQVTDQAGAEDAVKAVTECGGEGETPPGVAFTEDDYLVLAEDDDTAQSVVDDAASASLADDDGYQRWVEEAGGSGIVTAYLSAEAPQAFFDASMVGPSYDAESSSEMYAGRAPALAGSTPDPDDLPTTDIEQLEAAFTDFEGAAVVVRFEDEALEVETAVSEIGDLPDVDGSDGGLQDLPGTTAIALGLAVSDTMVQDVLDGLAGSMGEAELEGMLAAMEDESGLELPEDVQTLLGDGVAVALDSSIDWDTELMGSTMPEVPMGARILGDPEEIVPVLEKVVAVSGSEDQLVIKSGDGVVVVGPDEDYLDLLLQDGDLGEQDSFQAALPELDGSAGGFFVDFDAGDWLVDLTDQEAPNPDEVRENVEPLDSLGITAETDGDVVHGKLRLSTD